MMLCDNYTEPHHENAFDPFDFLRRRNLSEIILLVLIITFTILGNTLVLVVTWKERSLHQPNKYFIACLAVADLFIGLFVAPSSLHKSIVMYIWYDRSKELYPEHNNIYVCRFLIWTNAFSLTASIYTLTFISFDRYLKISKPLQYKSRMTTSRALKIIFIILLISSCFATYAAAPRSGRPGILYYVGLCKVRDNVNSITLYTFMSISVFFLPTIIILIMYALIFVVAHKRRKMLRNGELGQINNDENKRQRTTFLKDLKVIRMLLIVVGVFIFCWGPSLIYLSLWYHDSVLLHTSLNWKSVNIIALAAFSLPMFNSVCNPIIYACLDQTYKEAFKKLSRRMMCRTRSRRQQVPNALELCHRRARQQNLNTAN